MDKMNLQHIDDITLSLIVLVLPVIITIYAWRKIELDFVLGIIVYFLACLGIFFLSFLPEVSAPLTTNAMFAFACLGAGYMTCLFYLPAWASYWGWAKKRRGIMACGLLAFVLSLALTSGIIWLGQGV